MSSNQLAEALALLDAALDSIPLDSYSQMSRADQLDCAESLERIQQWLRNAKAECLRRREEGP
jgi:hypothetical protein